ncbi:hypothetical protein Bca52824_043917 [Brassica carinata]|uniref:Uncharacterized protein n=1 Tax=Brassica carinata TaxID=52824 RepID=A0A8X7RXF5_BRACI|nr:hypothetical protein Bca52824_043917 [Brassica carinata]
MSGARICINRGGIPPLEHISSSYLLHLILKYFQMANSRVFFSDLKSGKCSLKLCCRKDCEELAATVMIIVDCIVNKTLFFFLLFLLFFHFLTYPEKIELSTDVLKGILRPVVERVEEISWPPRNPKAINQMEMTKGFLSEVSAQLRQAKENKDKPGLAGKLQKVLQLYPATILSKHSYAKKVSRRKEVHIWFIMSFQLMRNNGTMVYHYTLMSYNNFLPKTLD